MKTFLNDQRFWAQAAVILLGLVLYSVIMNSGFHFDDYYGIVENSHVHNLDAAFHERLFRRITFVSFALNYAFGGLNSFGYHFVNVLIHGLAGLSLYWLVKLIFDTPAMKLHPAEDRASWIALAAALIFVAHPVQTESVTYIYQRATSLAGLFYVASMALYVWARLRSHAGIYILALAAMVLAFFSKQTAVSLPLVLLLLDFLFFAKKHPDNTTRAAVFRIPLVIGILIVPLIMLYKQGGQIGWDILDKIYPVPSGFAMDRASYLLTEINVLRTYVRLLFLPINQTLVYQYPVYSNLLNWPTVASAALHLSLLSGAAFLLRRRLLIAFSIFWAYLTLAPEFIVMRDVIFEHRLYLPSMGFAVAVSVWIFTGIRNRKTAVTGAIVLICLLSAATLYRNSFWTDPVLLWKDAVSKAPGRARAHMGLGVAHARKGNTSDALRAYQKALEVKPDYTDAIYNMGILYHNIGSDDYAEKSFLRAVEGNPAHTLSMCNLSNIYFEQGRIDDAVHWAERAFRIDSAKPLLGNNLGFLYYHTRRRKEAAKVYKKVLRFDPYNAEAINNLRDIYLDEGRRQESLDMAERSVKLEPYNLFSLNRLGISYGHLGKVEEAMRCFEKVIAKDKAFSRAYHNLAVLYRESGEWGRVEQLYAKLLEVEPDYRPAVINRVLALQKLGREGETTVVLEKYLARNPEDGKLREALEQKKYELKE